MKSTDARFAKSKYLALSELGTRLNLSFSSQLEIGDKIIALDGNKKCLLVLETKKESTQPYIIDLDKVAAVSVKKSYGKINQGSLRNKAMEEFLTRIDLQFEFTDETNTMVLPFYDSQADDRKDRPKLDRNAKNWQMILSKMAGPQPGTIILLVVLITIIVIRQLYFNS
jgi:hypothetical protein